MRVIAIVLLSFASRANGHGYMTEPPSRQFEAYEANGWPNEVAEYDPHGVAAGGMYSECDGCSGRSNYGPNPWSAPGTARAVDFVMGGAGNNILGVCGASPSRDNDYNTPLDGHWGMSAKTTYKAGDVIDVAWCVSADHGGVPQFRLCDDEGLVSAVTTPGYKPTVADHEALEQCFQRGLLRCDGVDSNTCDQVAECDKKMVYVDKDGSVKESRSWMRVSIVSDAFWGALNLATVFFQTLFSEEATQQFTGKKRVQAPGPRRGGLGGGGGFNSNVPMAGG